MSFFKTIYTFLKDEEYRDLLITTFFVIGFGTVVYHQLEGWDWIDALYFSVITLTTVGYGDYCPQTPEGKLFTIFYIILGIGIILTFIHTIYNHYASMRSIQKKSRKDQMN